MLILKYRVKSFIEVLSQKRKKYFRKSWNYWEFGSTLEIFYKVIEVLIYAIIQGVSHLKF